VSLPAQTFCVLAVLIAATSLATLQPSSIPLYNPLEETTVTVTETSTVTATETSTTSIFETNTITTTSTTTESVTVTTTSISTSTIYVPTLVGVTVTTTLSTYTLTERTSLTYTTIESTTTTATTTETAPFWNTVSSDPGGLCVLTIGVISGALAVYLHKRYPWAGPIGIVLGYLAFSAAVFQIRENRVQYLLGCFFVIIGAIIERIAMGKGGGASQEGRPVASESSNPTKADEQANAKG